MITYFPDLLLCGGKWLASSLWNMVSQFNKWAKMFQEYFNNINQSFILQFSFFSATFPYLDPHIYLPYVSLESSLYVHKVIYRTLIMAEVIQHQTRCMPNHQLIVKIWKNAVIAMWSNYPSICLGRLKNTMKNLSHDTL